MVFMYLLVYNFVIFHNPYCWEIQDQPRKVIMKKYLFTSLAVLVILFVSVGTVAAAPNASGSLALVSVEYVPSMGPVFKFSVDGKLSKSQLKGSLHVNGGADYKLSCSQPDKQTIRCTASRQIEGVNVVVSLGGSTFWAYVPSNRGSSNRGYCYGIYDWTENEDGWTQLGTHCQDDKAEYGDFIIWDNPYWGTSPYVFLPGSPECPFNQTGDNYYFPLCPP